MSHTEEEQRKIGAETAVAREPLLPHKSTSDRISIITPPFLSPIILPQDWPTSPKTIKSSVYTQIWSALIDVLLSGCSVAFLAFALIVNSFNQIATKEHYRATKILLAASKYGPTVFPILFAAVVGRASHTIFGWHLEKGTRMGVLDTLASSTSLTSTITSQFRLRAVSPLGIGLVAIWALSPIGGQASFRQLSVGTKRTPQSTNFTYMVPNGDSSLAWGPVNRSAFGPEQDMLSMRDSLFIAALLGPTATKRSAVDIWGNVKIPSIELYEGRSTYTNDGWFDVLPDDKDLYTSFIGVPISNINSTDFIDYALSIETMYFHLSCSVLPPNRSTDPNDVYGHSGDLKDLFGPFSVAGSGATVLWSENTSSRLDAVSSKIQELEAFQFTYVPTHSYAVNDQGPMTCITTTTYVEVELRCPTSTTCAAARIRRSQLSQPPSAYTQMDLPFNGQYNGSNGSNWEIFIKLFLESTNSTGHNNPTLLDKYLKVPGVPTFNWMMRQKEHATAEEYALRLQQLLNAFWACLNGLFTIAGGVNEASAFLDSDIAWPHQNVTFRRPQISLPVRGITVVSVTHENMARSWRSEGIKVQRVEIIEAHRGWVVTLCLASVVLIVASLVPPIARYFVITGPDVMVNVSSLTTRNVSYVSVPTNGTFMEASERARLLRDYKVQFGDIEEDAEIGRLTIGVVGKGRHLNMGQVQKRRTYK